MLGELETAIDDLEVPLDGAVLANAFALRDRLDAKLTAAAARFDAAELWEADAATSMVAWLRDRADMTPRGAGREANVARRLSRLPVTAAAWGPGSCRGVRSTPSSRCWAHPRWGSSPITRPTWSPPWWVCRPPTR